MAIEELITRLVEQAHGCGGMSSDDIDTLHADLCRQLGVAVEIATERWRQNEIEGWTPAHDDEHTAGEMAYAAACYAVGDHRIVGLDKDDKPVGESSLWPWHKDWWKPSNRRRDLVKAGALIVAEIERLDRARQSTEKGE